MRNTQLSWNTEVQSSKFYGCWVAVENCRYDLDTGQPTEADVVDWDENLADLCDRLSDAGLTKCTVLFCDTSLLIRPRMASISNESNPGGMLGTAPSIWNKLAGTGVWASGANPVGTKLVMRTRRSGSSA